MSARSVVWAVVVTYNRLALLEQCLDALAAQTRPVDRVLVVDNASTDGTGEWLAARTASDQLSLFESPLSVLSLGANLGGAGGFAAGMQAAYDGGADWLWLMDDDTIPMPSALEELLVADPDAVLRASVARWKDGRLHPMNVPGFERDTVAPLVEGAARGVLPLRTATFVSLLVARSAVASYGLPDASYFLWSDDMEYTARVTRGGGRAVLATRSEVEHRTARPHTAVSEAGERFYFHARNTLWMVRGRSWSFVEKLSLVYLLGLTSAQYVRGGGSVRVLARGLRDGVRTSAAGRSPSGP